MSDATSDPEAKAEEEGKRLRRPKPDELFIDLDTVDQFHQFQVLKAVLDEIHQTTLPVSITPSFTEGHRHVVVRFARRLEPVERVAYELALGSDRKRGLLGLHQIENGYPDDASVFFERLHHPIEPDRLPEYE